MKVRDARKVLGRALREKPEGLTGREIYALFPDLSDWRVYRLIMHLYDRDLIGLDLITNPGQARWR